jgi:HAD superfamily hydrolase (TIGR01509 family)
MPVRDLVLAELPTEIDVLGSAAGGKVDDAFVRILHDRAELVNRVRAPRDALEFRRNPLVELDELSRIDPAAVARNLRRDASSHRPCACERAAVLDERFDERADLAEQRIRLVGREDAFRHTVMIENVVTAGQRVELAAVDAVTLDAFGTLLELDDPIGSLSTLVPGHARGDVERAFRAEAAYYQTHAHEGRDAQTLARLRADCTAVFNAALGTDVDPGDYVNALRFVFLPGALDAIDALRARGLEVAVVSNWDAGLHDLLAPLGLVVVTSADAGVAKPDPQPLRLALARLGIEPARALHVGDSDADAESAAAAGVAFAPAPFVDVVARWT